MNLELDKNNKNEKKEEERLNISVKEFREIFKESKLNIIAVNKQTKLLKEVLNDEKLAKIEKDYKKILEIEEEYAKQIFDASVVKEYIKKIKEEVKKEEKKIVNISINLMQEKEEIIKINNTINKIKNFYFNSFIALFIISFLIISFLILFK